jgi:ABC-type transporter MlaC component
MKKLITITLALLCASAIVVQAQDTNAPAKKMKKELTAEQKAVMDEMLAKYDTDHNGKLDKTERAAMTKEDKDKMAKAGLGPKKKAAPATDAAPAPAPAGNK